MEDIVKIITDNYIIIGVVVFFVFALIGFIADTNAKKKARLNKVNTPEVAVVPESNAVPQTIDNIFATEVATEEPVKEISGNVGIADAINGEAQSYQPLEQAMFPETVNEPMQIFPEMNVEAVQMPVMSEQPAIFPETISDSASAFPEVNTETAQMPFNNENVMPFPEVTSAVAEMPVINEPEISLNNIENSIVNEPSESVSIVDNGIERIDQTFMGAESIFPNIELNQLAAEPVMQNQDGIDPTTLFANPASDVPKDIFSIASDEVTTANSNLDTSFLE